LDTLVSYPTRGQTVGDRQQETDRGQTAGDRRQAANEEFGELLVAKQSPESHVRFQYTFSNVHLLQIWYPEHIDETSAV